MADTRNATTVGRTVGGDRRHRSAALIATGVATSSAAALAFEIALTRVFAVAQFYHFAFLSVSLALLGFGASGSALTAFPALGSGGPRRWGRLAAAQSIATVAAYLVINTIPFDSFAIAWDRRQILYLLVYYLVLAVPFFFAGLIVAVLLMGGDAQSPVPSHRIYAASLVGSAAGAVIALVGIDWLGGAGAIFAAAALAMAAAAAFGHADSTHRWDWWAPAIAAAGLVLVALWVPPPVHMRLSPYKDLSGALRYPGAEIVATRWDGGTRLDLVRSDGIRSLPGVSLGFSGGPPRQDGLTFDGDELSPVPRVEPVEADFAGHLLGSLAYLLRPGADVLVLEPRGGFDVLVALALDADAVVAVEPHADAVHLAGVGGRSPYDDERVTLAFTTPRTYLERTDRRFDIIDVALTSPYRPVASGAYSLAEDYRLTIEAFEQALERLAPDGIVTVMRWVQLPASEETRLLATAVEALRRRGADPSDALVMLRSYATAVLLVQPDGFSAAELDQVAAFAEEERFDIVTAPNLDSATTNRYNVVPDEPYSRLASDLLAAPDPAPIYRSHAFEIAPATDDHPFFGHYFKWSQAAAVRESLGRTWQPFGGAGYFVLLALLAISTVAALILIAAPLLFRSHTKTPTPPRVRWWTVAYFGLLGIAFLFIEIPLIQRYILLVGQPAEAFAVVVFAILVASGVGSAWSRRIAWRPAAIVLALAAAGYPLLVAWITPILLPAPALLRMVAAALLVAPLGFLMGVMFPRGLAYLETAAPQLVPWAWGINGTVSVISAAAAAVFALSFGFSFVVWMGALAYGGAAVLARSRAQVA